MLQLFKDLWLAAGDEAGEEVLCSQSWLRQTEVEWGEEDQATRGLGGAGAPGQHSWGQNHNWYCSVRGHCEKSVILNQQNIKYFIIYIFFYKSYPSSCQSFKFKLKENSKICFVLNCEILTRGNHRSTAFGTMVRNSE